ncbi:MULTISPECIES: WxL domain-containing protein [Lactococcus]|uniref:WxL domain-containing protein n=1 Tax=Lactococcus TaxID=1357 RepID=UPI000EDD2286|nr:MULTISPECIES: WxL domain-containing protein [Lactococcus]HAP14493.1 WxL domain-containing protein [Lactococcus sp.]
MCWLTKGRWNEKKSVYSVALLLVFMIFTSVSEKSKADSEDHPALGQINFLAGSKITPPISPGPEHPGVPVSPVWPGGVTPAPGTAGPLSIDYASSFDFGVNAISAQDKIYYAKAQKYHASTLETPNYVQVTDNRGTLGGWTLKVLEVTQFHQGKPEAKYPDLKGAMLSLKKPEAVSENTDTAPKPQEVIDLVPGKETLVAAADKGAGAGTWMIRWGSRLVEQRTLNKEGQWVKESFNTDVQLFVPGKTFKDSTFYTTQLKWILSELPQNS